jgi:hypothetical protein
MRVSGELLCRPPGPLPKRISDRLEALEAAESRRAGVATAPEPQERVPMRRISAGGASGPAAQNTGRRWRTLAHESPGLPPLSCTARA